MRSTVTTHYQCDYPGCAMAASTLEEPAAGSVFFCASVDLCDGKPPLRAVHCLEHRMAFKLALTLHGVTGNDL